MKELLSQYASYTSWANTLLVQAILLLPEEKQKEKFQSSYGSLYLTVLHMWDASSIWWQRIKLQERITVPSESFTGDMKELAMQIQKQDKLWQEWVAGSQEHMMQHVIQYRNLKKEMFKQPVFQVLLHLFNHGTYHRGQLVNLLRQAGVTKIPCTDFIVWSRK